MRIGPGVCGTFILGSLFGQEVQTFATTVNRPI